MNCEDDNAVSAEPQLMKLDEIRTDRTQTREAVRQKAVDEYSGKVEGGTEMAPVVVYRVDGEYLLAAGHHRYAAYKQAGRSHIPCVVIEGTMWDAIEYGIRDNHKHVGERLTNADKAHAIQLVLKEKSEMSNPAIAELCGSTDKTVARYRRRLESTSEIPKSDARIGRDGRSIRTTAIGGADTTLREECDHPAKLRCPTCKELYCERCHPHHESICQAENQCSATNTSDDNLSQNSICRSNDLAAARSSATRRPATSKSTPYAEAKQRWEECYRYLGKFKDELQGLHRATRQLGTVGTTTNCKSYLNDCRQDVRRIVSALDSWGDKLGLVHTKNAVVTRRE